MMARAIQNNPASFRLSKEKRVLYEAEAAKAGVSLSIYLKQKLESLTDEIKSASSAQKPGDDQLAHLVPLLQRSVEFIEKNDSERTQYRGMMLEILLLLRCTIQPHKVNMVQAEVERRGLDIWTSDSWKNDDTKE